jgi:hypothetical protein
LHLAVQTGSPVGKVVELIEELKAKIEADGANEQKIYDKFACWCETTTQRKADSIDAGKELIGKTTTTILTLKGAIAVLASEIAKLEADIAKNNEEMAKLTKIREKENSDYQEEKAYMETTLTSLHAAIEVLGGAGTGGDMGLLKVASNVRTALLGSDRLSEMTGEQQEVLRSWLENPTSFLQGPKDYYDKKAQAKASYSPQSATIMGILKDMYDTFSADLEKSNQDESNKQLTFEDLIASMTKQNKLWTEEVTSKEGQKSEKSQMLVENEELLAATQEQLKTDEEFFETARDSCKAKSNEWDERGRLRTEQLDGIQKALKILTSDEARATFESAHNTRAQDTFGTEGSREMDATDVTKKSVGDVDFLQIDESSLPREKAYRALKQVIGNSKNLRLARLAASVRTATTGHFDEVMAEIDKMIQVLKDEAKEDQEQRDWCIDERNKERNSRDDLVYEIEQLAAKIKRAEEKKAKLEAEKEKTEQNKADLIQAMEEALADRTAENEAFHAAKDDDEKAVELLGQAIDALSEYGKNNPSLMQILQPEFEVSEDQAPDATFSSSDKHGGAQGGIIQMLTQIKENLEIEVKTATGNEAEATLAYEKLKSDSDAQIVSYDNQITELDGAIAETDAQILADNEAKKETEGTHEATVEYLAKIAPNCDWIEAAFHKRAEMRAKESEGLVQAKAILAGADGGQFGFLQRVQ